MRRRLGARVATAGAVAMAALACLIPSASAHGGNADYRSEVNAVTPSVPGLEVSVLNYDAELELVVPRGTVVEVPGYEGEPYVRVLADGTVQVNQRSPATYLNEDRYAETSVPEGADVEADPAWETIEGTGRFVFHDHRMHYMAQGVAPQVEDEGVETKVFDYSIPIRVDGEPGAIDGALYWVGAEDSLALPFIFAGALLVLLGGIAVLVVRRRRGGGDDERAPGPPGPGPGASPEAW